MEVYIILAVVTVIALLANYYQDKNSKEPLVNVIKNRLCSLHSWKEVLLVGTSEKEEYLANPEKFLKNNQTTYCNSCGYVPSKEKMIKTDYLKTLQRLQVEKTDRELKERDVGELKEQWFKEFIVYSKLSTERDKLLIRMGYDAYDSFVTNLPELVEKRKLNRIMEQLKGPDRTQN